MLIPFDQLCGLILKNLFFVVGLEVRAPQQKSQLKHFLHFFRVSYAFSQGQPLVMILYLWISTSGITGRYYHAETH
jgi:hypothetical protein